MLNYLVFGIAIIIFAIVIIISGKAIGRGIEARQSMKDKSEDYQFCINLALDNAKNRINLLSSSDKKCVIDEYREWIRDGFNKHTVLLLREDPII